jgi:serine/threonine protein phosphatase PrpC
MAKHGYIVPVGQTMRVGGVLSVTRAIGDISYKDYLISDPELSSIQICPQDQYLILSTDGLYKIFSKQYVAKKVIQMRKEGHSYGEISEKITMKGVNKGCTDNITLLIIDLQYYYHQYH